MVYARFTIVFIMNISSDVKTIFVIAMLYSISESKCKYEGGSVTIGDVLQFITGCSTPPPAGYETKFLMTFTEEICYPTARTCTYTVLMPVHQPTYQKFKEMMVEAIVSGRGFGRV